jgi:ribosomal-protein-alanine N-acetyltransferase
MMTVTRLLSVDDAEEMAAVLAANREFLAPWEPLRTDDFFTVQAQRANLERALEAHAREAMVPLAIVDKDGQLIGRININGITRGAFQSATVGYWVSQSHNGRGFASTALADVIEIAFKQLRLHRLQAETLLHNTASQRVLTRNGFQPFAIAPTYLKIAGRWQDFIMFHLINPDEQ